MESRSTYTIQVNMSSITTTNGACPVPNSPAIEAAAATNPDEFHPEPMFAPGETAYFLLDNAPGTPTDAVVTIRNISWSDSVRTWMYTATLSAMPVISLAAPEDYFVKLKHQPDSTVEFEIKGNRYRGVVAWVECDGDPYGDDGFAYMVQSASLLGEGQLE